MGMYFLLNSELDTDMEKMEKEPGNINNIYTSKFNLLTIVHLCLYKCTCICILACTMQHNKWIITPFSC